MKKHSLSKEQAEDILSPELQYLIKGMLEEQESQRLTVMEVYNSDWIQKGEIASNEEVVSFMEQLKDKVEKQREEEMA